MRRIRFTAAAAVMLVCALAGCSRKGPVGVVLDETPVISGGLGWGLVSLAYARLLVEPSSTAAGSGAARRNEIGRITARSRIFEGRDAGVWYRLELDSTGGWLHESAVDVYRSEAEARKAAGEGS